MLGPDEPVLSLNEVHDLVRRLVAARDEALRAEYDSILEQRLTGHFPDTPSSLTMLPLFSHATVTTACWSISRWPW